MSSAQPGSFVIGTLSLLSANFLLSLYPVLIKRYITDVSIFFQMFLRFLVYTILAIPFFWGSILPTLYRVFLSPEYIGISIINLVHVYTSYKGFQYLNTGIAVSTFYSYPLFQVILSTLMNRTRLTGELLFYLFGCILGVVFLNWREFQNRNQDTVRGLIFIFFASITEAIINIFYKYKDLSNPFESLYSLYSHGTILFLLYYVYKRWIQRDTTDLEHIEAPLPMNKEGMDDKAINHTSVLTKVVLFNVLIGAIGYTLRLHSVTLIPMEWFSGLTFTSAVAAFLYGWFFFGEQISWNHLVGTALIFYNIYGIKAYM